MSKHFKIGDRVKVPLGRRNMTGSIVEDRGAVGVKGRHLYQILVPMDPFDPEFWELSEDDMELDDEAAETERYIRKPDAINYLKQGGLVSILRSNLAGGKNQPRVWLTFDSLGGITHTFYPERGRLGGEIVPFLAIHDNRVFKPKQDEVLAFLMSFGLNRREAEEIIASVGVGP